MLLNIWNRGGYYNALNSSCIETPAKPYSRLHTFPHKRLLGRYLAHNLPHRVFPLYLKEQMHKEYLSHH